MGHRVSQSATVERVDCAPSPFARGRSTAGARPGILGAIGGTPLIELTRALPDAGFRLYGKIEGFNAGGSAKDRPALAIIEHGLRSGLITADTVVVESSSGNMGIGLAQACSWYELRFICVVDPKATLPNLRLIKAYGGEIEYVAEPDPESGDFLQARLARVQTLIASLPVAYWPNQYANPENSGAHYSSTVEEIVDALDGELDYLFCATSTCGTIRGCGEYLREHGLATRIVAVDAVGSSIFGHPPAVRRIPGLGAGIVPPLLDRTLIDEHVHVDDLDCVVGCRRLARREAILVGGSSGGVFSAIERVRERIEEGAVCAAVFPDRGERYLDTVFSNEWVADQFGDVAHLWES